MYCDAISSRQGKIDFGVDWNFAQKYHDMAFLELQEKKY